jgi:endonuclease YncB( thermonuclease family)
VIFVSLAIFVVYFRSVAGAQSRVWRSDDCRPLALVTRVFDGDTVVASGIGRVRLLGIDAPEMGGAFERPAPFAIDARERLQSLVLHRWVRLECDGTRIDTYGRGLFYVLLETGEFVNATLVRQGLARVSTRTRLRRWDELRRAEEEAQSHRRGMWGEAPRWHLGASDAWPSHPRK